MTSSASAITAASMQPPETEPTNSPCSLTASLLPAGRGELPQVRTTVASATPSPARFQATACASTLSRSWAIAASLAPISRSRGRVEPGMKLAGEYVFEAEIQEVWDALFDPAVLAAVMPGCEKLELVDGAYVGEIKVKVGPIQGKFAGKVDLLDQVPPTSYRMIVDGKGPQGFVKATATIVLAAEGTSTRIKYDSDAQVGGKIATVGQRLVETSARAI